MGFGSILGKQFVNTKRLPRKVGKAGIIGTAVGLLTRDPLAGGAAAATSYIVDTAIDAYDEYQIEKTQEKKSKKEQGQE